MQRLALVGEDDGAYAATFVVDPVSSTSAEFDRVPLRARALHLLASGTTLYASLVDGSIAMIPVSENSRLGHPRYVEVTGLPCHAAMVVDRLVVSLYRAGALAIVSPHGAVRFWALPAGPDPAASPRPHHAIMDPAGRYLLVCDAGTDAIHTLDPVTLDMVATYRDPSTRGPRNLVFLPNEPERVFVTGETGSTVSELSYAQEAGRFSPRRTVRSTPGESTPAGIAAGPSAVYQTNRQAGTITVVSTAGPVEVVEFRTGAWPMDVDVWAIEDGHWLVVANRDSGELTLNALDGGGLPAEPILRVTAPRVSAFARLT